MISKLINLEPFLNIFLVCSGVNFEIALCKSSAAPTNAFSIPPLPANCCVIPFTSNAFLPASLTCPLFLPNIILSSLKLNAMFWPSNFSVTGASLSNPPTNPLFIISFMSLNVKSPSSNGCAK